MLCSSWAVEWWTNRVRNLPSSLGPALTTQRTHQSASKPLNAIDTIAIRADQASFLSNCRPVFGMNCTIPSQTPDFPSLYNPLLENWNDPCDQDPRVVYLYHSGGGHCSIFSLDVQLTTHGPDIFRFTLYWTLLTHMFLFGLPGLWALFVHLLPRWRRIPGRDGTALIQMSSTPRNHNTYSSASLEDLPPPSPAFSPSPLSSSADVQDPTQPSTLGHLRFAAQQSPTHMSPSPTRVWDSWTPSIRLRNLRSRSFDANAPHDNETQSASLLPPTSPTPFSLSYIPASRPASSFIPVNTAAPVTRPNTSGAPIQPPSRLPRFQKPPKANVILVFLIPLVFVLIGALIGVLGSLVLGYLLAALRDSAQVQISTWLPLGWAVVQALVILGG
jgi:hypothetical protein